MMMNVYLFAENDADELGYRQPTDLGSLFRTRPTPEKQPAQD